MTFTKAVSEQHVHVTRSKKRCLLECMSDVDRQGSESERVGAKSWVRNQACLAAIWSCNPSSGTIVSIDEPRMNLDLRDGR